MASALRKTAHLLTALSSSLPNSIKTPNPPIVYHPLDLSFPELHRVLGEMDEAFGEQLKDKVACIGLHGDYEAGLQFIRDGKLGTLRNAPSTQGLELNEALNIAASSAEAVIHPATLDKEERSPILSATSESQITPGVATSPLPSIITDDDVISSGGSWSPVEGDDSSHSFTWPTSLEDKAPRPLHLVFLGSSLGNFPRDGAVSFLRSLPLRQGNTLLLGLDGRPTPGKEGCRMVEIAYNDPAGHSRAFEEHGWDVVRSELGLKGDLGVDFVGRYNEALGEYSGQRRSSIHLFRPARGIL